MFFQKIEQPCLAKLHCSMMAVRYHMLSGIAVTGVRHTKLSPTLRDSKMSTGHGA